MEQLYLGKQLYTKLHGARIELILDVYGFCLFHRNFNIYLFCVLQIKFKLNDVKVPDIPGMFCTFKAKGRPLFVDGSEFYEPKHFGKIMGYDKPLDLRWDSTQNITQSEADARKRNKTKE